MCISWPAFFQCCFPSYDPTLIDSSNFQVITENINIIEKITKKENSAFLSLSEDLLLEIVKQFSNLQLSLFSQVSKGCLRITESDQLPSIHLIKLIASKIQGIPNRTFNEVRDVNVYRHFSVKINNVNNIIISNVNPLSRIQHIPIDKPDFNFTRNLIVDEVGAINFFILDEITIFFELESINLTKVNPKLAPGIKESISRAISLVKPTI